MFGKRRFSQLGLALLLGGACACGQQQKSKGIDFDSASFEGFDETHFDLLAADCVLNGAGDMTLAMGANETAYLFKRSADGKVVANASIAGSECTTSITNKITITGAAGDQKVILDYYSGVFAAATTTTPNITIDLGAGTGDTVKIRGTAGADLVTLGTRGTTSYFSLNTVGGTRAFADVAMTGVENIMLSTGPGNDTITGQGGTAVGSTTALPVVALDGAITLTVWGGDGDDTITSGALSVGTRNVLYGGAGNDLFLQQAAFAADTINGGAGTDTVDYGIRTTGVRVTLGATTAAAAATGSFSCAAKAAITDNDSFQIFSDATHSKTFAYNKTGAGVAASGSITCPAKNAFADNDFFSLGDGTHTKRFYYQKTANAPATGSIDCIAPTLIVDNDWFVLHDGVHTVTFEYDQSGTAVATHGGHLIHIQPLVAAGTDADVATATANAIIAQHGAGLTITAAIPNDKTVHLTNDANGTVGNVAIDENVADATFVVHGMTGGTIFAASGGNASPAIPIDISGVTTNFAVASATYTAILGAHAAGLTVTATDPAGSSAAIALVNDAVGTLGNVAIDITGVSAVGFSKTGMASGSAAFVKSAGNIAASATVIDISGATTAAQVCAATYTSVHGAHTAVGGALSVAATDPSGATTIALVNDTVGVAGNVPMVLSTGAPFSAIGMRNGVTAAINDDGELAASEADSINGEVENIIGSSAADTIDASQVDTIHVLMGMGGNDTLIGGPGHTNYLYGGAGDDKLYGGGVADFLFGGTGDDLLQGGLGNDTIDGGGVNCVAAVSVTPPVPFAPAACTTAIATAPTIGAGSDTIDYSDRTVGTQALYVDLTNLTNCLTHKMGEVSTSECDVIVSGGTPVVASVKNIRGGAGDDTLIGDSRANIIWGGAGNDIIDGSYGNDAIYGEAGNDNIRGGPDTNISSPATTDDDYINGGIGTNTLNGGDGIDTIDSSSGADAVDCGAGDGDINVPSGNESPAVQNCEF